MLGSHACKAVARFVRVYGALLPNTLEAEEVAEQNIAGNGKSDE